MFVVTLTLVACLALASSSRDPSKPKALGTLTHSIVNLGKMDINIYLNEKKKMAMEESPKSQYDIVHPSRSLTKLRPEPFMEECRCSNLRSSTSPQSPTDILSKILMSNDLFSFHNDPVSSSLCCSSHEQVQEELFIEFSPKQVPSQTHLQTLHHNQPQIQQFRPNAFPYLPFLSENFVNKQASTKQKGKAVEMFLFPTKKTVVSNEPKRKPIDRSDIQVVGDKKTTMLYILSDPAKSSVKKDLTQDKVETGLDAAVESVKTTSGSVNNSNTL